MALTATRPAHPAAPGEARRWQPARPARAVTLASVGLVAVAMAVAPLLPAGAGPGWLLVAGLVGLPHGAVDHLALGWVRGRPSASTAVIGCYAAAAAAAAAAALAAPVPALLVLLVLSAAHFAEGERAFDRLRGGPGHLLPAAAVGTCVVVVPLLLRPALSLPLLASLDRRLPELLLDARIPLLLVTAALVLAGLAASRRTPLVAAELMLIVAACLLASPLIVFGTWFACWHSPRHLVRLADLEPRGDGRQRQLRLARGAVAPTLVAVLGLIGLACLLGAVSGALVLVLLALTVPHAAVVVRLDRLVGRAA